MSTVSDVVKCPQCGYEKADYEFNCRTSEDVTMCRSCGYYECWDAKYDEDGERCGWKHEISRGAGALWYSGTGRGVFCGRYFNSTKEVLEAERWLRERLEKGEVDAEVCYLTRWNGETKQVEFIIGKFYESTEDDANESEVGVATPVQPPQQTQPDGVNAAASPTDAAAFLNDES
ncbi:MAG: hypothetical protein ACHP8B_10760 [Terriglobales bacterium]